MRLFKREVPAFWVDIYFFGAKAADNFDPSSVRGTLSFSRIGPTQVQVLSTSPKALEAAAHAHERSVLEELRRDRLEQLAEQGAIDAIAATSAGGEIAEISAASEVKKPTKAAKKRGCKGCGK